MPTSEARILANQQNALLSTGPRTTEGKERSRQNGLKHGLTGRGVALAEDDVAEIERRVVALENEMRPKTSGGVILIRKMATFSVRSERAAGQESAALARRVRHAPEDFDEERYAEADRLFDGLHLDPRSHLRKLRRSPEGVDRMLEAWSELRDDLTRERPSWTEASLVLAASMTGIREQSARGTRLGALSRAVGGDFAALGDREGGGLGVEARKGWARKALVERIDTEISELEAHRETLDFEMIALDRAESGSRALFDPGKEAMLARRYEAEAHRGYFKALKEFRQVEAEAAALKEAKPDLPPPPAWTPGMASLGSHGESGVVPVREPVRGFETISSGSNLVATNAENQPSRLVRSPG